MIARQTISGVAGRESRLTPRGLKASRRALTIAGGAPKLPDSEPPLTPKGLLGLSVVWAVFPNLGGAWLNPSVWQMIQTPLNRASVHERLRRHCDRFGLGRTHRSVARAGQRVCVFEQNTQ